MKLLDSHTETGGSVTRNARAIAFLRIFVGALFLIFGEYKVFGTGFTRGGGFQFWINRFLQEGAYPFMVPVLKNFVLPHATALAFIVAYGELAIGIVPAIALMFAAGMGGSACGQESPVFLACSTCSGCCCLPIIPVLTFRYGNILELRLITPSWPSAFLFSLSAIRR